MKITKHGISHAHRGARFLGWVFLGICAATAFALIFGLVIQFIWNWLMPGLFGLREISFLQAFALIILARIFFGGFSRHHGRMGHHHSGWHCANREAENEPLPREIIDDGEGFKRFWDEEGRESFERYIKKREGA